MWVDTAALPRLLLGQTASLLGADFSANLADFSTYLPTLMDGPREGRDCVSSRPVNKAGNMSYNGQESLPER